MVIQRENAAQSSFFLHLRSASCLPGYDDLLAHTDDKVLAQLSNGRHRARLEHRPGPHAARSCDGRRRDEKEQTDEEKRGG